MNTSELLLLWSDNPSVSVVVWAVVIILAMYLGRQSGHRFIEAITGLLNTAFKVTSDTLTNLEENIVKRNKQVILHEGRLSTERLIEREFHRVNTLVSLDLSGYPAVQRQITDTINKIEADYQSSNETPPSPPDWLEAVDAISKVKGNGDSAVDKILINIQESIEQSHEETMNEYRKSSLNRLQYLKKMLPSWRDLSQTITGMSKSITDLSERAEHIDKHMDMYEKIRVEDDKVANLLSSSSLTQFFISTLVLVIAILGGVINFQLIALPMSEMVGGTTEIAGWKTADIAAMVIIMIEVAMGLFLLESLRITNLFSLIGSMDDKMRRRMMIVSLTILTILASVEASLAYMRDLLSMDREVLMQSLSGVAAGNVEFRWIPSIGQMVMGFVLPFALAFVAIPLESFIHSGRTVIGLIVVSVVRVFVYAANLLTQITEQIGKISIHAYDMVIFLPLTLEQKARQFKQSSEKNEDEPGDIEISGGKK
ncbi:MAG: hypothetical protein GXP13_09295 [Gammaproteobacteria bacterium]|nr:hypothetical protein [Gammaproteobacteria bacterium]